MENVIVTYFHVESEAYQALSKIKELTTFEDRVLFSQIALLKKMEVPRRAFYKLM